MLIDDHILFSITSAPATMPKPQVDYSIYYVTGRPLLPPAPASYGGKPEEWYLDHLELALQGGVTIVQIREKDVDGGEFYEIARRSKEVCDKVSPLSRSPESAYLVGMPSRRARIWKRTLWSYVEIRAN